MLIGKLCCLHLFVLAIIICVGTEVMCAADVGGWEHSEQVPLNYYQISTPNVLRCGALCKRQGQCIAATFDKRERTCYLHNSYDGSMQTQTKGRFLFKAFHDNLQEKKPKSNCDKDTQIALPSAHDKEDNCKNIPDLPLDCTDLLQEGKNVSGVYTINPFGIPKEIFCDQDTDGGRWMVFQRRKDGSEDFYRNWADYEEGFGNLKNEFWIGLKLLHFLTSIKPYEVLIELENWSNEKRFAAYSEFSVSNSSTFYVLNLGTYTGNEGNALQLEYNSNPVHDGSPFSTKDQDHSGLDCAIMNTGGFWYANKGGCHFANPNGEYLGADNTQLYKGMEWYTWTGRYYSLKKIEMKIRQKTSF